MKKISESQVHYLIETYLEQNSVDDLFELVKSRRAKGTQCEKNILCIFGSVNIYYLINPFVSYSEVAVTFNFFGCICENSPCVIIPYGFGHKSLINIISLEEYVRGKSLFVLTIY